MKVNALIMPSLGKHLGLNKHLKVFHLVHFKLSLKSWETLAQGLGECNSLISLTINVCNLNDNQIRDADGIFIVKYIKNQCEKKESALWMTGLRH
jgi:hypothetical protein